MAVKAVTVKEEAVKTVALWKVCLATRMTRIPLRPGRLASLLYHACIVVLACAYPVWPQVSGHQRLGVESRAYWEGELELAVRLVPAGYDDYGLPDLDTSLTLGLLLDRKWSVGISAPYRVSVEPGTGIPVLFIPKDLTASFGCTAMHGDSRVGGSLNITMPSAIWQGNQEVPGSVTGGSGRWTLGLSGGLSRIIDPLVLSGFLSWSLGLPRAERWDSKWRPADLSLVLSVTEAFNEHVSCTLGLSQYISVPECAWDSAQVLSWGSLPYGTAGYDAVAGVEFLLSGQSITLGIGISKGLIHGADPGSASVSVGYNLSQKEKP